MAYIAPDNQKRHRHDARLRKESSTSDIFSDFVGARDVDTPKMLPDAVITRVPNENGETTITIPMLKELTGDVSTGTGSAVGTEESQVTVNMKVYANAYWKTVATQKYGVNFQEAKFLKLMDQINPQIGQVMSKKKGQYIRESLCEIYSSNLADAPISLTQKINPNIAFVDGTATTDVLQIPTYNPTTSTFATNIQDVVTALGTPDQYNRLSVGVLNKISDYAIQTKSITPLIIGGKERYILTMSPRQKSYLMDPKAGNSTLFTLFKDADNRGSNRALKYEMYEYGNLLLYVDERFPVCTVTGGAVSFAYKGVTDARDTTSGNTKFDVCFLLGREAVYEYVTEPLHYKENVENYERDVGLGAFTVAGYTLAHYDAETPTATSIVQQGSALILATSN